MLTSLRRIVLEFSHDNDLESALRRMVSQIKLAMKTDCCSIYIADHKEQNFVLMASDGLAKNSLGHTTINFTEGLIGLVAQREEPLNITDAQKHPHFIHAPEVQEEALNAFLGTPIIHRRKVLGVIAIQQKNTRHFNENEEAFIVTLAAQIATSFANTKMSGLVTFAQGKKLSTVLQGVAGSSGVAMAPMLIVQPHADLRSVAMVKAVDITVEMERLAEALSKTRDEFKVMAGKLATIITDNSLDIFEMYTQLLNKDNLGNEIAKKINLGWCVESALKLVVDNCILQFESLDDSYLRERGSDIRDLGNRLLFNLKSIANKDCISPVEFILVADEVTASMVAEYQHIGLRGIVSLVGSTNSHAAILARALAVPAIMGVERFVLGSLDKKLAIVDGYSGELFVEPSDVLISEYKYVIAQEGTLASKVKQVKDLPAITPDGQAITLLLNAGLSSGFAHSKHSGAAGVGLYRTEIPFMNRSCFPSEMEQTSLYQQVLEAFPNQTVTMRTLDVGGDKALPYFSIVEDNPFLGWRGIRITLDHPEIFLLQVRAMMRANLEHQNLEIMLPMVSSIAEVEESLRLVNQAFYELSSELSTKQTKSMLKPKIGIMIEVPSVIFQLSELAKKVDFFSVGSNDLTQYLLAVDRNNARVSTIYSSYHPAVLRALKVIADQAIKDKVPLSLCGEMASEPAGAILLLAMGYDKLSMNPHNVAKIKWVIRHVELRQARQILSQALNLVNTQQVLSYLNEQLELLGLGAFVRAGM